MKLGFENKWKTGLAVGLLVALLFAVYINFFAGPPSSATDAPAATVAGADTGAPAVSPPASASGGASRVPAASGRSDGEFHPVLHKKGTDQQINPLTVDPTIHLEVLAKLQEVSPEGGARNLFQFGPPPPPPASKAAKLPAPEPVVVVQQLVPPAVATPPPPPPPPPIPLKYYAISTKRPNGKKTAFFIDGDQILMGGEGDILKKRYRVVRFGVNSVVIEDTQFNREQSLPLEENASLPG